MKKVLSSLSKAVLLLCLIVPSVQAMKREHEHVGTEKIPELPSDCHHRILSFKLLCEPESLDTCLRVCKHWHSAIKGCDVDGTELYLNSTLSGSGDGVIPLDFSFYSNSLTNEIIRDWHKAKIIILDEIKFMSDDGIKNLTNLTTLDLNRNKQISDEGIKNLTNLTTLALYSNKQISDDGIKGLTNLTDLYLRENDKISDGGIKNLTNLTTLDLSYNDKISDDGIKGLTNLTTLYLERNKQISDDGIKDLLQLNKRKKLMCDLVLKKSSVFLETLEENPNIEDQMECFKNALNVLDNFREKFPDLITSKFREEYNRTLERRNQTLRELDNHIQKREFEPQRLRGNHQPYEGEDFFPMDL